MSPRNQFPRFGIVVPVYNEEKRFNLSYWQTLIKIPETYWIFIDDGSTDSTYIKIKSLGQHENVEILRNINNSGKAESVRLGINHFLRGRNTHTLEPSNAQEYFFGYLDSDCAFDEAEIATVLLKITASDFRTATCNYFDLYLPSRVKLAGRNIQRTIFRHYIGRAINTVLGVFIKNLPYDSQCGFKIFRGSEINTRLFSRPFRTKWLFDVEIILRYRNEPEWEKQIFMRFHSILGEMWPAGR